MSHHKINSNLPVYTPPSRVRTVTGFSRSTAFRLEKRDPTFPRRVRISPGLTAWRTDELLSYLDKRERVK
jgi:predicted DNA-binding transcriptional regulator AlpA